MDKEPEHVCKNCLYRHGCKYELKDYSQECPHFKIGKCFICALRNEETMCEAEDQSGYGCSNYKE